MLHCGKWGPFDPTKIFTRACRSDLLTIYEAQKCITSKSYAARHDLQIIWAICMINSVVTIPHFGTRTGESNCVNEQLQTSREPVVQHSERRSNFCFGTQRPKKKNIPTN